MSSKEVEGLKEQLATGFDSTEEQLKGLRSQIQEIGQGLASLEDLLSKNTQSLENGLSSIEESLNAIERSLSISKWTLIACVVIGCAIDIVVFLLL